MQTPPSSSPSQCPVRYAHPIRQITTNPSTAPPIKPHLMSNVLRSSLLILRCSLTPRPEIKETAAVPSFRRRGSTSPLGLAMWQFAWSSCSPPSLVIEEAQSSDPAATALEFFASVRFATAPGVPSASADVCAKNRSTMTQNSGRARERGRGVVRLAERMLVANLLFCGGRFVACGEN